MAKIGSMPGPSTVAPVAGVPHIAVKNALAPKQRQNLLNVRVGPVKRMQSSVKGVKADKPDNIGNF